MIRVSRYRWARAKLAAGWHDRALNLKAVRLRPGRRGQYGRRLRRVFVRRAEFDQSPAALAAFTRLSSACGCGDAAVISLIAANTLSWLVAVTGSYIMNSSITFAAESDANSDARLFRLRRLRRGRMAGQHGWPVVAAEVLLLPVWLAKALAILASFIVNFSLSHFVVFRVRPGAENKARNDA